MWEPGCEGVHTVNIPPSASQHPVHYPKGQVAKKLSQFTVSTLSAWEAMSENQHHPKHGLIGSH